MLASCQQHVESDLTQIGNPLQFLLKSSRSSRSVIRPRAYLVRSLRRRRIEFLGTHRPSCKPPRPKGGGLKVTASQSCRRNSLVRGRAPVPRHVGAQAEVADRLAAAGPRPIPRPRRPPSRAGYSRLWSSWGATAVGWDLKSHPQGAPSRESNAAMSAVHGLAIAGEKGPAAKVLQKNHKTWLADAARLPGGRAIVYLRRIFVLGRPQS